MTANYKNHKWDAFGKRCVRCGVTRTKHTAALLMAMVGSKDYYKYEQYYKYHTLEGQVTTTRPNCSDLISKK